VLESKLRAFVHRAPHRPSIAPSCYLDGSMSDARLILVTGGAGFVGATLVRRLVEHGFAVRVLDNLTSGDAAYLAGVEAELVVGDIRDVDGLDAALRRVSAVVHLAAAGSVVKSVADPVANFDVNVVGTFRVLDAARRAGVERIVQASTGGALIGDATPPVDEKSLPKPISPYGASKLAGEGYAHAFAHSYGMRTVALRFANVYGPYSARKQGAMTTFFRAIHGGSPILVYGDGTSSRDYAHVDDIARAIELGLTCDVPGGTVLHIASGVETTVLELAELCRAAAGVPEHPIEHRPRRPGEVERNFASYALAKSVLGFAPSIERADGIRRTWQWFVDEVFDGPGSLPGA
jgi:UDP-glucose 4-epimerase